MHLLSMPNQKQVNYKTDTVKTCWYIDTENYTKVHQPTRGCFDPRGYMPKQCWEMQLIETEAKAQGISVKSQQHVSNHHE